MSIPALIPLQQWVCDTCGEVIEHPEHGYTEWLREKETRKEHDFRIVHRTDHSPRQPHGDCYVQRGCSTPIPDFLGENGTARILTSLGNAADLNEFVEFIKRLTLPYYEEARFYWNIAETDGFFESADEFSSHLPGNLKALVERYRSIIVEDV